MDGNEVVRGGRRVYPRLALIIPTSAIMSRRGCRKMREPG